LTEQFDGVFIADLTGRGDQKAAIWGIYTQHYGLDPKQARPDDANWTDTEIKSCCRLASRLGVPLGQAAQNVVPVAVTAGDKIEGLRQWASGSVPVGGSSGGVFEVGSRWRSGADGGAGRLRLP
jgi:hypothetical protein